MIAKIGKLTLLAFTGLVLTTPFSQARQVDLDVALAEPFLQSGEKQNTYLRVSLTGFEMKDESARPPVNVVLVIDKSGSMSGDKIANARNAAKKAVSMLSAKDIVSVVAYNHEVSVLVPSTKVSDKEMIHAGIDKLQSDGRTALFAGVSKGAEELRKFIGEQNVNRVILLSDGLANVGPSSPKELGDLGMSLGKDGITVTTMGLGKGYNEDLMTQLAYASDGNHAFIDDPEMLAQFFATEFGDLLSVVAQEVTIEIHCREGIRPVQVLNREADIVGQKVTVSLNQLYSEQEKYILLEIETPAGEPEQVQAVADVKVSYDNMFTTTTDQLASNVSVRYTDDEELITNNRNREVMIACVMQRAVLANERATALRDAGKVEEARQLLIANGLYLKENGDALNCEALTEYGGQNYFSSNNLDDASWNVNRKAMRAQQFANKTQQRVTPEADQKQTQEQAPVRR